MSASKDKLTADRVKGRTRDPVTIQGQMFQLQKETSRRCRIQERKKKEKSGATDDEKKGERVTYGFPG